MLPQDLGLPAKFANWRRGQWDAVIEAAASEQRFYLLSMPTGGGKSAAYIAVHRLLGGRTCVLTSTKGLQDQLLGDFASMGMVQVKGQNNYQCLAESSFTTCNEGPCHSGVECDLRHGGCLYYDAVRQASRSELVVTNYRYWMTVNRYSDPETLGQFDTLVLDEAHDAPEELADFCTIRIDEDELHALLKTDLPPLDESQDTWGEWAGHWAEQCRVKLRAAKEGIREDKKNIRLAKRLNDLLGKLVELSKCREWHRGDPSDPDVWIPGTRTDWVAERTPAGAQFSPVWAHRYAESYLFKGIKRIILVSATLQPKAAEYLGIPEGQYEFKEMDSQFSARRRPLIWVPTTDVSSKWSVGQQRIWLNRIDEIIEKRASAKGIVHTRSYDRAQMVLLNSKQRGRIITHGSRDTRDVVARFKRERYPRVLVSPSMETGWDFPYDECRFQIVAKVPFVDTRSAIIQARVKADKKYQNYLAALSLIQMVGRGMRAEDDWCETFIIDDNWRWFKPAASKQGFFPDWFLRACQTSDVVAESFDPQTGYNDGGPKGIKILRRR